MLEFIEETLSLLPFLFTTFLVLEAVEAHSHSKIERFLERSRSLGPFVGSIAGAIPQCGVSAAAASFYAGGVISVGTLLAVFLSTSDELVPVLISSRAPVSLMLRIVFLKVIFGIVVGFSVNAILSFMRHRRRAVSVEELCEHSRCHCHNRKGILLPALIHTSEIFLFIIVVSGAIELCMHFFGEDSLNTLKLTTPFLGEMVAGLLGMIPNCAVSVASAELYMAGAMSPGALMASSFTGSGLGLLVLLRTNRNLKENLLIVLSVFVVGTLLGWATGPFIGSVPD